MKYIFIIYLFDVVNVNIFLRKYGKNLGYFDLGQTYILGQM